SGFEPSGRLRDVSLEARNPKRLARTLNPSDPSAAATATSPRPSAPTYRPCCDLAWKEAGQTVPAGGGRRWNPEYNRADRYNRTLTRGQKSGVSSSRRAVRVTGKPRPALDQSVDS